MTDPAPPASARPEPPERPLDSDCCDSGCETCVFTLYSEALARWRLAIAAFDAAHAPPNHG